MAEEMDITTEARELAEAEGVDLAQIEGTGEGGRILVGDVRAAIAEAEGSGASEGPPDSPAQAAEAESTAAVVVNRVLGAKSYTFGDGETFYRDAARSIPEPEFKERARKKIGGRQVLVKAPA